MTQQLGMLTAVLVDSGSILSTLIAAHNCPGGQVPFLASKYAPSTQVVH